MELNNSKIIRGILLLLLTLFSLMSFRALAQNRGKISGSIVDSSTREKLEGVTVSVINYKTGLFINYGVSNKKGEFLVAGLPEAIPLQVILSLVSYADTSAIITLDAKTKLFNTGVWGLTIAAKKLDAVIVTTIRPPFVVKNDTLEFDASVFKMLPNDMVQDLLRKIPGMQIDGEGNVTMNGRKVDRIRVDGRGFFSGNLKVALENLPGAIIDKVQVMDSRQKGTEYNSIIKPLAENLTINLVLRKDKKTGIFGNVSGGAGAAERYTSNGFFNQFRGERQLALTAKSANISDMVGGQSATEYGLLKNAVTGGINLNDNVGKKGKLNLNYVFNRTDRPGKTITERTNILPGGSFLYNSQAENNWVSNNHNLVTNFEFSIDSLQQLIIGTFLSIGDNSSKSIMASASASTNGIPINKQQNSNNDQGRTLAFGNQISYNRSSRDHNTHFTVNWSLDLLRRRDENSIQSENIYFSPVYLADSINQQGINKGNTFNNNVSLNLLHQWNPKWNVIVNYTLLQNNDIAQRNIYSYNASTRAFDELDSLYSNHNRNIGLTHLPSARIGYTGKNASVELGLGYRIADQRNHLLWSNSVITVKQHNFSPQLSTSLKLNKTSKWLVRYLVESTAPGPDQLSPVQDNTNPLYIRMGNPALQSTLMHVLNTQLEYFSRNHKWQSSIEGSGTFINNLIADDIYYDSLGRQFSTFRNVDGTRSLSIKAKGGGRFKLNGWNIFVSLGTTYLCDRNTSLVNRELSTGNTLVFTPQININLQYRELIFLQTLGSIQYYSSDYTLQQIPKVRYQQRRLMFFARVVPIKRLQLTTNLSYIFNGRLPADFQRTRTLVNSEITYNLLKKQQLTVGILVNDLLNDNTNVTRRITPTAIETVQRAAIRRYGMLTVQYRFNRFSGSEE